MLQEFAGPPGGTIFPFHVGNDSKSSILLRIYARIPGKNNNFACKIRRKHNFCVLAQNVVSGNCRTSRRNNIFVLHCIVQLKLKKARVCTNFAKQNECSRKLQDLPAEQYRELIRDLVLKAPKSEGIARIFGPKGPKISAHGDPRRNKCGR